ncbi:MAG: orotate phosphoribosyltransferase [Pseudomonadales bacterium]|nr:orotate phosphoribosyltransferase [Pseudomonadales bacterium]
MNERDRRAASFVREMIDRGVLTFGDFVLKSGRESPYFFNLGEIADGAGLAALGSAYAVETLALPSRPEVLFGPAYKGIPIATATAIALARDHGVGIGAAFNRKEVKDHGEGGHLVGAAMAGRKVAIVDDLVTDGTAKREAFETITDAGGEVVGVVLALDRQEPSTDGTGTAVEVLEHGFEVPVRCVATLDDVVDFVQDDARFADRRDALVAHRTMVRVRGGAGSSYS